MQQTNINLQYKSPTSGYTPDLRRVHGWYYISSRIDRERFPADFSPFSQLVKNTPLSNALHVSATGGSIDEPMKPYTVPYVMSMRTFRPTHAHPLPGPHITNSIWSTVQVDEIFAKRASRRIEFILHAGCCCVGTLNFLKLWRVRRSCLFMATTKRWDVWVTLLPYRSALHFSWRRP